MVGISATSTEEIMSGLLVRTKFDPLVVDTHCSSDKSWIIEYCREELLSEQEINSLSQWIPGKLKSPQR